MRFRMMKTLPIENLHLETGVILLFLAMVILPSLDPNTAAFFDGRGLSLDLPVVR